MSDNVKVEQSSINLGRTYAVERSNPCSWAIDRR